MKKILLPLILVAGLLSCKEGPSNTITKQSSNPSESFDWLSGDWERVNEQEGRQTYESWQKVGNSEYYGFGFTLQNSDTIWQENIRLIKRETGWNFEVTGKGETQPTIFRLIHIEANKFDSENQENDFPKVISYYRKGSNLHAVISGGGNEIPFEFVPLSRKMK